MIPIQMSNLASPSPSIQRAGTIRQMLCGVNPRSAVKSELPLSQIDSPCDRGNRFANAVPTQGF